MSKRYSLSRLASIFAAPPPPDSHTAKFLRENRLSAEEMAIREKRRQPVPVSLGGAPATQADNTTCGSAVLTMIKATVDPDFRRYLDEPDQGDIRFSLAQRQAQAATCQSALGPISWPRALGTPPWTLAREIKVPGYRYRSTPLDDETLRGSRILAAAYHATRAGLPVPLYSGGNLTDGLAAAVPRHVVLAVPPADANTPVVRIDQEGQAHFQVAERSWEPIPTMTIYDPSAGMVERVELQELFARTTACRALGNWTHVCWALLPYRAAEPAVPANPKNL